MDIGRQLADLLYSSNPEQPAEPQQRRIAQLVDPERLRRLGGIGEAALTFGTGLAGSVPAGLAGMAQMIPTRGRTPDVNKAAQTVEDVQGALTYIPRGETGQRVLQRGLAPLEMLGAPAEYIGEKTLQYTGSPAAATAANVLLDPVNFIGLPGSGKAAVAGTKAAGRAAAAAPRVAGEMAQDLLMGQGRRESQRGAIKVKGGNWLAGEVEGATEPLRQKTPGGYMDAGEALAEMRRVYPPETTNPDLLRRQEPMMRTLEASAALNNWIDKKLNRYIRNEMGTPEDPVRKLAEQGILHYEPRTGNILQDDARIRRLGEGEQLGVSPLARAWEDNADLSVIPSVAQDFQSGGYGNLKVENPWIEKVSPESKIYSTSSFARQDLGLDHLIDELKNSIRPDSDLPAHLRWKPEDLEKVTMEQAVRRVHEINEYRAAKKAEANEVLARNPATVTFKEYPTVPGTDKPNEKGLTWKEIKPAAMPEDYVVPDRYSVVRPTPSSETLAIRDNETGKYVTTGLKSEEQARKHLFETINKQQLQDALKYEGDVMGHCVGGYCDDVLSGETKIYSLRDKKGEPHVTIEVAPPPRYSEADVMEMYAKEISSLRRNQDEQAVDEFVQEMMGELQNKPSQIIQIKGKGNRAPKEEYLPFVQDFVRNGNWSRVGDIENAGLYSSADVVNFMPQGFEMSRNARQLAIGRAKQAGEFPPYVTRQEYESILKKFAPEDIWLNKDGKKEGGSVHISNNPDTMQLELAAGGAVKAAKAAAKQAAKAAEKEGLSVPFDIPRAPAKSKEEIRPIAERMARQMTGEFVRLDPKESINPAGKSLKRFLQEKEFEKDYITRPTKQVTEPEFADIEKQLGMVKFGIPGDTTIANQELIQAGPYKLDIPSPQHGGPRFPLGGEGAWASNNPQAANVQKRAVEMSEYFNAPVMGQYIAMGPVGSNFAQHFADASLRAIDLSKMSKSQVEQFNELIRKGSEDSGPRPSFPGIQDKDQAYLWLSFDPELRKHFNSLMVRPKYTQPFGLPDGRVILDAITEPALRNKEISTSGFSQFDLDPSIRPEDIPLSEHPTYTHLIPMKKGAPVRQTRYPIPAELEFPDVTKFIRENYRPAEFTGTFQKASPRQKIDQQAIDEIKMYEEMMKSLTGKKKGGAVKMQAGGALKAAAKAAERAAKAAKPEVLPAAEREANLKKMLKSSHVKRPVYHGTNKTDTLADESGQAIRQFDSYVNWFTQDPYHASGYATQDGRQIEGAATYPAYLSLQRPLHLRGDLNDKTTYAQFRKETGLDVRPGPYEDEVVDGVEQMIPRWWITNSPSFADAARAAGFDGVIANEGGTKTFGIFYHEPGKIKSAIGNRGTFDVTNPDITKKRGGKVKFTDNLDTMRLAVQKRK